MKIDSKHNDALATCIKQMIEDGNFTLTDYKADKSGVKWIDGNLITDSVDDKLDGGVVSVEIALQKDGYIIFDKNQGKSAYFNPQNPSESIVEISNGKFEQMFKTNDPQSLTDVMRYRERHVAQHSKKNPQVEQKPSADYMNKLGNEY